MKRMYIKPDMNVVIVATKTLLMTSGVELNETGGSIQERGIDNDYEIL